MQDKIILQGKIGFEPVNKTKKHDAQSSWKRIAMVNIYGDVTDYYSWFIKKRYNLILNKPLRGAHISFINDKVKDFSCNGSKTIEQINTDWDSVKNKWDKKKIEVELDLNPRTNSEHWWLKPTQDTCDKLQAIRSELNLGVPFWNFHMTIGYANDKNIEHSKYIHHLLKNGFITT